MSDQQEAPDHLFAFDARAKGYQMYVHRLKKGGTSGISEVFGSAEDLFSDPLEYEGAPQLELKGLESSLEQIKPRAISLAQTTRQQIGDFLRDHLEHCQSGALGTETKKKSLKFEDEKAFSAAVKDLCCVSVYLTALEQGLLQADLSWAAALLNGVMQVLDRSIVGPSVVQIMSRYDYYEVEKVCQKAASSIGDRLGFGLVGDPAWNAVRKYLLSTAANRAGILKAALEI